MNWVQFKIGRAKIVIGRVKYSLVLQEQIKGLAFSWCGAKHMRLKILYDD